MPTIRDVAKHAKVSVGTVSNVLNGNNNVREETRQRVLDAIEALNFHPSAIARSLTTQRTNTIGMIRTELRPHFPGAESDPFILDLIDGVSSAAEETRTGVTFWTIPVGSAEMELYRDVVLSRQVDGLIVFALRDNDPRLAFLREKQFPFVVFGRPDSMKETNWIDVDGAHGIELAVTYLGKLGHQRIGYLSPPGEQFLTRLRWQGFLSGIKKIGADIDMQLVLEGDFTERSGEINTHQLLDLEYPPTAIVCNNDRMAFGAMRAIQSRGYTVGHDIAVVGFDDITLSRYWHPPLTTIRQPIREIGQALFHLLLAVIEGLPTDGLGAQLIKPELQIRESTR
ncbi:MAG: LacI family transcriptional regulator [Anaerolineae bacterium]|nr:LacI family transcriptional regulator [Anaerolineae bacterium]